MKRKKAPSAAYWRRLAVLWQNAHQEAQAKITELTIELQQARAENAKERAEQTMFAKQQAAMLKRRKRDR